MKNFNDVRNEELILIKKMAFRITLVVQFIFIIVDTIYFYFLARWVNNNTYFLVENELIVKQSTNDNVLRANATWLKNK